MSQTPQRPRAANDDATLRAETATEQVVGVRGPTNWSRIGLLVLAALILIVLVMRFAGGNTGTDVVPGTPVAAPQTEQTGK